MRLFDHVPTFDFMGPRRLATAISGVFIVATFALLLTRGLNWGIDFTGGVLLEFNYAGAADLVQIRDSLTEQGF